MAELRNKAQFCNNNIVINCAEIFDLNFLKLSELEIELQLTNCLCALQVRARPSFAVLSNASHIYDDKATVFSLRIRFRVGRAVGIHLSLYCLKPFVYS